MISFVQGACAQTSSLVRHLGSVTTFGLLLLLCTSGTAWPQIQYQDVSKQALDLVSTESWGLSVGDYNGDGWQDIYVTNHRDRPSLHRNNGDGTFTDIMIYADKDNQFNANRYADHHQGMFSDVDNDGDDDLLSLQLTRGMPSNTPDEWHRLPLFSDSGYLTLSGTRTSDKDGWSALNDCTEGHPDWFFPMYGDLDGDLLPDYLCVETGKFELITPGIYNGLDYAIEDFDNDLRQEIFAVVGGNMIDDAKQISPTRAEAFLQYTSDVGAAVMRFHAPPPVTFSVNHRTVTETVTLNGGTNLVNTITISHSSADNYWTVRGINTDTEFWKRYKTAYVIAEAAAGITDVTISDQLDTSTPRLPRVMKVENGNWQNRTWTAGFRENMSCTSVVMGDFDNDKDQDMYLTCREGVENTPNRMFQNDGNGVFTEVLNTGTEGLLGAGIDLLKGLAENTVILDYNNDGFLDLMSTNGKSVDPIRRGGHPTLFRNLGNENHWIQLELRASGKNYSAVGARVIATTGSIRQLRFQNAGLHRFSQNQQRIHFGLGEDTKVNLEIRWPNGEIETLTDIPADKIYEITQGQGTKVASAGQVPTFEQPSNRNGGACGEPPLLQDRDEDLFLFQTNCNSNAFKARVTGGSDDATVYKGRLIVGPGSTISAWSRALAESHDRVEGSSTLIEFEFITARNDQDGFNFTLSGDDACLILDEPSKSQILVGKRALPVIGRKLNPKTLTTCAGEFDSPVVSFSSISVNEADGTVELSINLSNPSSTPVEVYFATREGTATAPEDFYGHSEIIRFAPGDTSATVSLSLVNDSTLEQTEFFDVRLFGAEGAVIATSEASVTIVDDDDRDPPRLIIEDTTYLENIGTAEVTVSLTEPATGPVSVKVATNTGTASKGSDYYGAFNILNFAVGDVSQTMNITIIDDQSVEGAETFKVRLFGASGAEIGVDEAIMTITDDDLTELPALSINPESVNEDAGKLDVIVALSAASTSPVTVKVATIAVTATQGTDFYGTFRILSFEPGETKKTVTLTILDDQLATEGTETFDVRMFGVTGATILRERTPMSIVDND